MTVSRPFSTLCHVSDAACQYWSWKGSHTSRENGSSCCVAEQAWNLIDWCLCVNCEIEMDRWRNKWGRRCIYRRHWCLPDHSGEQRKRERGVWRAMEWLRHKIRKHQMLPQLFTSFLFIPFFIHLLHPPTHISFSFYSRWFIMNTCSLLLLLF